VADPVAGGQLAEVHHVGSVSSLMESEAFRRPGAPRFGSTVDVGHGRESGPRLLCRAAASDAGIRPSRFRRSLGLSEPASDETGNGEATETPVPWTESSATPFS
jgi:hypothetical protein